MALSMITKTLSLMIAIIASKIAVSDLVVYTREIFCTVLTAHLGRHLVHFSEGGPVGVVHYAPDHMFHEGRV